MHGAHRCKHTLTACICKSYVKMLIPPESKSAENGNKKKCYFPLSGFELRSPGFLTRLDENGDA